MQGSGPSPLPEIQPHSTPSTALLPGHRSLTHAQPWNPTSFHAQHCPAAWKSKPHSCPAQEFSLIPRPAHPCCLESKPHSCPALESSL
eukprot:314574-Chlamydomonas_euryale.AAC.1